MLQSRKTPSVREPDMWRGMGPRKLSPGLKTDDTPLSIDEIDALVANAFHLPKLAAKYEGSIAEVMVRQMPKPRRKGSWFTKNKKGPSKKFTEYELNILGVMGGWMTVKEIATKAGGSPDHTSRTLKSLYKRGLLGRSSGTNNTHKYKRGKEAYEDARLSLRENRRNAIFAACSGGEFMNVNDLAELVNSPVNTVLRDLRYMTKDGSIIFREVRVTGVANGATFKEFKAKEDQQ